MILLFLLQYKISWAREPGAANNYVPGVTLGTAVALEPPPGFYYFNEANFYSAKLTAANSSSTSSQPDIESISEAPKFIWSTPWTFLGAKELMWVAQPFVYNKTTSLLKSGSKVANANTVFLPINFSWLIKQDLHLSFMFSFNVPDGQYNKFAFINIGNHFWTFSPEMGISYVTKQVDLTFHMVYSVNTKNHATGYLSGNQIFIDITATKKWRSLKAGFVAYYDQQLSNDHNDGTFYSKNLILSKPMQFAPGALIGYTFKNKVDVQFYGTYDLIARDGGLKGCRIFSRVSLPIS